ncbi:MAG: recombinase zinc beta ribbon domain-containing protein, partial [Oscillospiraceae bacterium]|nr:recombinase zinc beta ribbon domain-containing protein [Oscillospiraceae bacterium]
DCLAHRVAKNDGALPQYFVENSHPAIIDRPTWNRVQEELARRTGKRKVKEIGTTTEQGKYSGKYALTELLVCGECGKPYRRVTWSRNGQKKSVWRCISRLDYGKKYCKNSPSLEENVLHTAILGAVANLAQENTAALDILKQHIGIELAVVDQCQCQNPDTVNFKTYRKSYKHKKTIFNDPSEYAVFENTHEAIIDRDTFDRVQQLRAAGKRRHDKSGRLCLFSGITYCADCGSRMYFSSGASMKPENDHFVCSGFRTKKRSCDSSHYIRRVVLESLILEQIQRVTAFAAEHEREFAEMLRQNSEVKSRKELADGKRRLMQAERRIAELDNIVKRLYEDNISGKLTDERFMKLSRDYEKEQQDLAVQAEALSKQISEQEQQTLDLERFLRQVRKYTQVKELTPTLLHELVERIEVHAPDRSLGRREQKIDVLFDFVGLVDTLELPESNEVLAE